MHSELYGFVGELLREGSPRSPALHDGDLSISRTELADRVADRRLLFDLPRRSVVVLSGAASIEWVVTYLALLDAGHVQLLAGDHVDRLREAWRPALVVQASRDGIDVDDSGRDAAAAAAVELHADLALLMSTSGSTGDPKLVRLSHANLASNAQAIAEYLRLTPHDCGITSLPLHYCYGLSVLHSHLLVGAPVVMSGASVVDPCFRDAMDRHGVTNVAGVPHSFDLLERAGPELIRVPSLRLLTQAGGKLPPGAVRRWLDRTAAWGAEFVVMYGQTEATARMAYLPPELARRRPEAIGIPIPGGALRIDPIAGSDPADVGELVYCGPNVMMGYATSDADLSEARVVEELRTGDLARFHADDGVYELVGRRSRFVKPFGLRIDLDDLERHLPPGVAVTGDDDGVVARAPDSDDAVALAAAIQSRTGLPSASVVVTTQDVPRLPSGKVDYHAILSSARAADPAADGRALDDTDSLTTTAAVQAVYAAVLGRRDVTPADSFVSLGGDSLSYIECSIRLERVLGRLPDDWHLRPLEDLHPRGRRRFVALIDTTLLLRAIAICMVVATHMRIAFVPGGAHLLLAVFGYNLARFMSPIEPTARRVRAGMRTVARVAVPTVAWVGAGLVLGGATYGVGTLLLVNNYVGPASHAGDHWHFWFIEVMVHVTVVTTVLLAIPAVRRAERRHQYLSALLALGALAMLRWDWAHMGDWYNLRFRTHGVVWFVALGWLVQRSDTLLKRVVTTAAVLLTVPGFFQYVPRERFIMLCLLALLLLPEIPWPRLAVRPVAALAGASMWIYITHFTFWPPLEDVLGVGAAYVATIVAGIAVWAAVERITPFVNHRWWVLRTTITSYARSPRPLAPARID